MRHFRASIPKTETSYLRRIQRSIDPRSEAACEIGFVLAYYHVDFDANFRRMLRSDYKDQYVPVSIVEGYITEEFADFLYRRQPSHTALRIWLNTEVDGEAAGMMNAERLSSQKGWQQSWLREQVVLLPGSKMLPAVQNCTQKKPTRSMYRGERR